MHRFYCVSENISGSKAIIDEKSQIRHLRDVLRLERNDEITIFDGQGNEYTCLIKELLDNQVVLRIKNKQLIKEQKSRITLACAIPKKSKMDDIIDKLTQLGVDRIIPLKTERVIIKLDRHKEILRQGRWKRIARNAAQQSGRCNLPIIEPVQNIKEVLSRASEYDLKLIPTLEGERRTLKEVFLRNKAKNILILIGPEGDFTAEEIDSAKKSGCIPVTLGDLVLRVETAAIAVVSIVVSILNYALRRD